MGKKIFDRGTSGNRMTVRLACILLLFYNSQVFSSGISDKDEPSARTIINRINSQKQQRNKENQAETPRPPHRNGSVSLTAQKFKKTNPQISSQARATFHRPEEHSTQQSTSTNTNTDHPANFRRENLVRTASKKFEKKPPKDPAPTLLSSSPSNRTHNLFSWQIRFFELCESSGTGPEEITNFLNNNRFAVAHMNNDLQKLCFPRKTADESVNFPIMVVNTVEKLKVILKAGAAITCSFEMETFNFLFWAIDKAITEGNVEWFEAMLNAHPEFLSDEELTSEILLRLSQSDSPIGGEILKLITSHVIGRPDIWRIKWLGRVEKSLNYLLNCEKAADLVQKLRILVGLSPDLRDKIEKAENNGIFLFNLILNKFEHNMDSLCQIVESLAKSKSFQVYDGFNVRPLYLDALATKFGANSAPAAILNGTEINLKERDVEESNVAGGDLTSINFIHSTGSDLEEQGGTAQALDEANDKFGPGSVFEKILNVTGQESKTEDEISSLSGSESFSSEFSESPISGYEQISSSRSEEDAPENVDVPELASSPNRVYRRSSSLSSPEPRKPIRKRFSSSERSPSTSVGAMPTETPKRQVTQNSRNPSGEDVPVPESPRTNVKNDQGMADEADESGKNSLVQGQVSITTDALDVGGKEGEGRGAVRGSGAPTENSQSTLGRRKRSSNQGPVDSKLENTQTTATDSEYHADLNQRIQKLEEVQKDAGQFNLTVQGKRGSQDDNDDQIQSETTKTLLNDETKEEPKAGWNWRAIAVVVVVVAVIGVCWWCR